MNPEKILLTKTSAISTNITGIRFLVYWLKHSRNTGCGKETHKRSPKRALNIYQSTTPTRRVLKRTSIQPQTICSGYWKEERSNFSHSVTLKRSVMFPGQGPAQAFKDVNFKGEFDLEWRVVLSGWGNQCLKARLVQDSSFHMYTHRHVKFCISLCTTNCSLVFDLQVMTGNGGLRNRLSSNSDTAVVPAFQGQLLQLHSHRLLQFASHLHISNSNNEVVIQQY